MIKSLIPAAIGLAIISTSCGGKQENPEARNLLSEASAAFDRNDPNTATVLLDSLQKTYPSDLAIQREAMALRPKVIELTANALILQLDSLDNVDKATMTNLKPKLKWVKTPGMIEGYWIDAQSYNPNFMNSTGIEARVNEIGQFYIVSSVNPAGNLKHTSISLKVGNVNATTETVSYDGESNYRIGGGEVITFSPEQSDTIGAAAVKAIAESGTCQAVLTFHGLKGNKSLRLSANQTAGIANAYNYSAAIIRARDNQVERQRLNRTIEIARQQAAKTATTE